MDPKLMMVIRKINLFLQSEINLFLPLQILELYPMNRILVNDLKHVFVGHVCGPSISQSFRVPFSSKISPKIVSEMTQGLMKKHFGPEQMFCLILNSMFVVAIPTKSPCNH